MRKLLVVVFLVSLLWILPAFASTKVGNGDDGADLEGATPLTAGPILEARARAVTLLDQLGVGGIRGLGQLKPEVERSAAYLAPTDRTASLPQDQGGAHADLRGLVYARTLPQPHAATRFYPTAQELSQSQLIALHVHEGLHRALPEAVREDESVVSQLTLAITSPGATRDAIAAMVEKTLPAEAPEKAPSSVPLDHYPQASEIGYSFRQYRSPDEPAGYAIRAMHVLHSHLYPFGGADTPFGIGIEASLIDSPRGMQTGPLSLSARLRIWSVRGFDVGIWASVALNTLSAEELKNSPYGRDVYNIGLALNKTNRFAYFENFIGFTGAGSSTQSIGNVRYTYDYGEVFDVKVRGGAKLWKVQAGGFVEMHLANRFKVSGGAFPFDSGRYRIVSGGPEVAFRTDDIQFAVQGRWILNTTQDATFDYLGNLMGAGVAQGGMSGSVSVFF